MSEQPCMSCDRLAVIDGWCLPCAAGEELRLSEAERIKCRDLIATLLTDADGEPRYDIADAVWMVLYRAGFDIMCRPLAGEGENDARYREARGL